MFSGYEPKVIRQSRLLTIFTEIELASLARKSLLPNTFNSQKYSSPVLKSSLPSLPSYVQRPSSPNPFQEQYPGGVQVPWRPTTFTGPSSTTFQGPFSLRRDRNSPLPNLWSPNPMPGQGTSPSISPSSQLTISDGNGGDDKSDFDIFSALEDEIPSLINDPKHVMRKQADALFNDSKFMSYCDKLLERLTDDFDGNSCSTEPITSSIESGKAFMENVMENTNTYIQWPSRMKIGAKTKKDLFVRIYGHTSENVKAAKQEVLDELGPQRDLRITLKMEISYTDHSHLIGCRGTTIRKVMDDTGCHIHFPDSNRMSKEHKSNQVTIAGCSVQNVEQARSRVRELSPLIFQFNLPMNQTNFDCYQNPETHNFFINNIQSTYNVQVTVHPPNKLQQITIAVKGCEVHAAQIKEAVTRIIGHFARDTPVNGVIVESSMEITPVQHGFVRAVNDSNIHSIAINTGAKIIFPDLTDSNIQQLKRSRIYITGELNSVYLARQQLIGCLPLRMLFDLADTFQLEWDSVRSICADLNVNGKLINRNRSGQGTLMLSGPTLPPPIPGRSRTIQLVALERNAGNLFEVRRRILGGIEPPTIANIPITYVMRHVLPPGLMVGPKYGTHLAPNGGPLPPLLLPHSPNIISPVLSPSFWPPTPFSNQFYPSSVLFPSQLHPHHHHGRDLSLGIPTSPLATSPHPTVSRFQQRPYFGQYQAQPFRRGRDFLGLSNNGTDGSRSPNSTKDYVRYDLNNNPIVGEKGLSSW